ncbi:Fe-S cluster assembly ATPase SufC [bacterium]|nr:Fe-S cluster assembly ATPase SufC [bacterium]
MREEIILDVKDLHVKVEQREILKGLNLRLERGKIYALMGPNGAGKSTLAYAIMGHPRFMASKGSIVFKGEDITELSPSERARRGIFLAFQYPIEIPGITLFNFLRMISNIRDNKNISPIEFSKLLKAKLKLLNLDEDFIRRYLNEGFSGGEKKKSEILQMAIINPELVILDEIDSGLDIDAIKVVSDMIKTIFNENMTILMITHYQRLLDYIKPDSILVIVDGRIVASGGYELIGVIEKEGYNSLEKKKEYERV